MKPTQEQRARSNSPMSIRDTLRSSMKTQWSQLTDEDIDAINGQLAELEELLQHRYGWKKEQTREAVHQFLRTVRV